MSETLFIILFVMFLLITIPIWAPFAWVVMVAIIGALLGLCVAVVAAIFIACSTMSKFCSKHFR